MAFTARTPAFGFLVLAALLTVCLFRPPAAQAGSAAPEAGGWKHALDEHASVPARFLAVNKKKQQLLVVEKRPRVRPVATYACSTGQMEGDKWREGDLKTPEGVYFVGRKIASGLDYQEYGGLAYVLNYPNPVDRLRDKKGYGIWVHGKGHAIAPKETQGCIAMNTPELQSMDAIMEPGLPVVVAEKLETGPGTSAETAKTAALLQAKVKKWGEAWADRSDAFFGFYDPKAYSRAQNEAFSAFHAQKKRLFSLFPWIQVWIKDVRILQGPGYWVTWFSQYYRAPNLTTEGVRRLYWQQGADEKWRIVGMEWEPKDLGLEQEYLASLREELAFFLEAWRQAWEKGDVQRYSLFYADDAVQGSRKGAAEIKAQKARLWARARPRQVVLDNMRLSLDQGGVRIAVRQRFRDSLGYEDKGMKTLVLEKDAKRGWRIVNEDWRAD